MSSFVSLWLYFFTNDRSRSPSSYVGMYYDIAIDSISVIHYCPEQSNEQEEEKRRKIGIVM